MRITLSQLRKIIKEETQRVMSEAYEPEPISDIIANLKKFLTGRNAGPELLNTFNSNVGILVRKKYITPEDSETLRADAEEKAEGAPGPYPDSIEILDAADASRGSQSRSRRGSVGSEPSPANLWDPIYGSTPIWVHRAGKKPGTLVVGTKAGSDMREVPADSVEFKFGKHSEKFGIPYNDPYADRVKRK